MAARVLALGLLVTGLAGCFAQQSYYWGGYQTLLYEARRGPSTSRQQQVDSLVRDLERAREAGCPVPPGVHAYLGYLQHLTGHDDLARENLQLEKTNYPESSVMVERLLAGLGGDGDAQVVIDALPTPAANGGAR